MTEKFANLTTSMIAALTTANVAVLTARPLFENPLSKVRLLVAVASARGWHASFGHDFAAMTFNLGLRKLNSRLEKFEIHVQSQTAVVPARQTSLEYAMNNNFTHYLSLDDDMRFPQDIVERLLATKRSVITCNYRKKTDQRIECVCCDLQGNHYNSTDKSGVEEIGGMGMGVTLISIPVMRNIPAPWFAYIWNPKHKCLMDEAGVFSHILREHGIKLYCDNDTSQLVGHIGDKEYLLPSTFGAQLEQVSSSR